MARDPVARQVVKNMRSASWIREMFEKGLRLKAQRGPENVFDFSLGNPSGIPPEAFFDALVEVAAERKPALHRYMPNAGFPETRAAVARFVSGEYGWPVESNGLILTSGAAGGLNVVLHAICDPGDEVIVITPFFPEYRFYVEQAGARLVLVPSDEAFQPDAGAIAAAITPRTRAIIVNSPNNPTGIVYTEQRCAALAAVLAEHDSDDQPIYLVLDDPYRRIVFDGGSPPSPGDHYRRTILVSSYSKDLSIAGERAGYIAVPSTTPGRELLIDAMTMLNRTLGYVNMPALMQRIVARCADAICDISQYRRNRDMLCTGLRDAGYELPWPGGAMFAFPRTPIPDDVQFVDILLDHGILAVPGQGFGRSGHIRLSLAVEPDVIERALPKFAKALANCKKPPA